MDSIAKDTNIDLKEKKIIELAKKNSDLLLKNEKLKTLNKDLEKKVSDLTNSIQNGTINNNTSNSNIVSPNTVKEQKTSENKLQNQIDKNINPLNDDSIPELKKKLKTNENKIVELRNKNQSLKDENTKLITLLKKEIGETADIDKLLKGNEKAGWKGRAEMIEFLKNKVKAMENQISISSMNRLTI